MTEQPHESPAGRSGQQPPPDDRHEDDRVQQDAPEPRFDIEALATGDILQELEQRQKAIAKLEREKAKLRARIKQLDEQIRELSGAEPEAPQLARLPTPWQSDLNDMPLSEAIAKLYALGDEFSPADVETKLLDAGYARRTANLRTAVTQVLARELRFKRVSRGLYRRVG